MDYSSSAVIVVGLPCDLLSHCLRSEIASKEFYQKIQDHDFEIIVPYQDAPLQETFVGWIVASSPCSWYSDLQDNFQDDVDEKVSKFRELFDGIAPQISIMINNFK